MKAIFNEQTQQVTLIGTTTKDAFTLGKIYSLLPTGRATVQPTSKDDTGPTDYR